ncbi:MAG: cytochrome c maturation protein CcmE [Acidimicrobiales bacterium]
MTTAIEDAPAAAPGQPPVPGGTRRRLGRHPYRLLFVFALLAGAICFLLVEGLGSSLDYYVTVRQAMVRKAELGTRTIRLQGDVVRGSIEHTARGADFEVVNGGRRVPVREVGSTPQLFQPGIPVVIVGHFSSAASDLFVSNQIMVKHSATYVPRASSGKY